MAICETEVSAVPRPAFVSARVRGAGAVARDSPRSGLGKLVARLGGLIVRWRAAPRPRRVTNA